MRHSADTQIGRGSPCAPGLCGFRQGCQTPWLSPAVCEHGKGMRQEMSCGAWGLDYLDKFHQRVFRKTVKHLTWLTFRNTQRYWQAMLDIGAQQWMASWCGWFEQERNVSSWWGARRSAEGSGEWKDSSDLVVLINPVFSATCAGAQSLEEMPGLGWQWGHCQHRYLWNVSSKLGESAEWERGVVGTPRV